MTDLDIERELEAHPGAASDRLAAIRQRAQKIARDKSLTLTVPGYDDLLAIRYHGIPSGELDQFIQRAARSGEQGKLMAANADLIIRCCDAILIRKDEGGEWLPIDEDDDEPTTFSTATLPTLMPEFIGQATSARDEVFGLFSPDGSQPIAVGQHADALINWLQGNADEIDRTLLGE
jgi:hypothetical protein